MLPHRLPLPPGRPQRWSITEVSAFLTRLGQDEAAAIARLNWLDGASLCALIQQGRLSELGIASRGMQDVLGTSVVRAMQKPWDEVK